MTSEMSDDNEVSVDNDNDVAVVTKVPFSTERLISEIQEKEPLWKVKHPLYCNRQVREKLWMKVASVFEGEIDGEQCLKRWNNIRSVASRVKRSNKTKSGQEAKPKQQYKYAPLLEFLADNDPSNEETHTNVRPPDPTAPVVTPEFPLASASASNEEMLEDESQVPGGPDNGDEPTSESILLNVPENETPEWIRNVISQPMLVVGSDDQLREITLTQCTDRVNTPTPSAANEETQFDQIDDNLNNVNYDYDYENNLQRASEARSAGQNTQRQQDLYPVTTIITAAQPSATSSLPGPSADAPLGSTVQPAAQPTIQRPLNKKRGRPPGSQSSMRKQSRNENAITVVESVADTQRQAQQSTAPPTTAPPPRPAPHRSAPPRPTPPGTPPPRATPPGSPPPGSAVPRGRRGPQQRRQQQHTDGDIERAILEEMRVGRAILESIQTSRDDHFELWARSLCPRLRALSREMASDLMIRVMALLHEAETGQLPDFINNQ